MKILLLGGSGQVGFELQRAATPVAELVVPGFGAVPRADLADFSGLEKLVAQTQPDLVINAAAYTAVDKAETERDLAARINADAPGVLARAAAKVSAPLIHYSTDYVFDGSGSRPWREDDEAKPLNHYGATKLAGEIAVRAGNPSHLIFRTAWVYAPHGRNFANTMIRLAGERETLQVVADQFGAPTSAGLIADATVHATLRVVTEPDLFGTYHLVATGETSWHDYASQLLELSKQENVIARKPAIQAVTSAQFPTPALRPKNSRLSTEKIQQSFGLTLPSWQAGIARFVTLLAKDLPV